MCLGPKKRLIATIILSVSCIASCGRRTNLSIKDELSPSFEVTRGGYECMGSETRLADVRSIYVHGESGKLYQLWVDAADAEKQIGVHAWDYKTRKVSVQSSSSDLSARLEEVYSTVIEWDKDLSKSLSA